MPTGSERTVWGMGDGSTLRTIAVPPGEDTRCRGRGTIAPVGQVAGHRQAARRLRGAAIIRDGGRGPGTVVPTDGKGRQMFYSLAHPGLLDLLKSAEQLLADTGEAVALCSRYGDQGRP
jgi:hypothetical protein